MRRRELLVLCGGAGTAVLAGCIGDGGGTTDTPPGTATSPTTASPPGTPGGTIEYTVVNDDVPHEVTIELTAGGTVVEERTETLPPGESITTTSRGNDPARGPYELTVSLRQLSLATELKPDECPYINVGISITPEGTLSTEREVCQK